MKRFAAIGASLLLLTLASPASASHSGWPLRDLGLAGIEVTTVVRQAQDAQVTFTVTCDVPLERISVVLQVSQRNRTVLRGYFFPEVCDGTVSHTVSFDRLGLGRMSYVAEAAVEFCEEMDCWADEEIDEGVLILRPAGRETS